MVELQLIEPKLWQAQSIVTLPQILTNHISYPTPQDMLKAVVLIVILGKSEYC
jgi:hypothetical protein